MITKGLSCENVVLMEKMKMDLWFVSGDVFIRSEELNGEPLCYWQSSGTQEFDYSVSEPFLSLHSWREGRGKA